jgi:uncharacterized membrane protein HdeD (DUF308 family)
MATTDGPPVRDQGHPAASASDGAARHTGLRVALGILSIVVGILVVARPVNTLFFVAILFGLQLLILGIVRIALALSTAELPRWVKVLSVVLGILTIVAGVFCFVRPEASLVILAILLAVGLIADGIGDLAYGFRGQRSGGERTYLVVVGVVSIVAGLVVAIFPGPSLVLLTRIAGLALIVIGALTVVLAVMGRRRRT